MNKKCLECKKNEVTGLYTHHLSNGKCLTLNLYYKYDTEADSTADATCKEMDNNGYCIACADGHYFSGNKCCPEKKVNLFGTCTTLVDTNCKKANLDKRCT